MRVTKCLGLQKAMCSCHALGQSFSELCSLGAWLFSRTKLSAFCDTIQDTVVGYAGLRA